MSKSKHTPGNWHMGIGNGEGCIFSDDGRMRLEIGGTTLYPVCQVVRGWEDGEDDANARLIAAAPELLAALEAFREAIHTMYQRGDVIALVPGMVMFKPYEDAIAAIAKATGETHV